MCKPLVVCIAGPTAVGKTDAAIALCKALDGEAVSMDSMQVYRDMDIGTAKPSMAERQGVMHHLLSYVSPMDASYSVATYQRDATEIMHAIFEQSKLPVFVGGTGLYLQAVSHPLKFTKASGAGEIRLQLEEIARKPQGPQQLHLRLAVVDPSSAQRLHTANTRRIIRALEVYMQTGIPMSKQRNEWDAEPEQDWLVFALTCPREMLYARINSRVDQMIAMGLEAEVRNLLMCGVPPDAKAMQAIGYKEMVMAIQGECTLDEAVERIKMNTRRYAKRQLTWLRRDPRVHWLDVTQFDSGEALHAYIIAQVQHRMEVGHAGN